MGTLGYLVFMRKKGEADLENSPVDCFPAEPAHDVRGTSALRGPERSEDPTKVLRTFETLNDAKHCLRSRRIIKERFDKCQTSLLLCGRRDLNPHDIAITRSLVLLVYQFRHFRATMVYYHYDFKLSTISGYLSKKLIFSK